MTSSDGRTRTSTSPVRHNRQVPAGRDVGRGFTASVCRMVSRTRTAARTASIPARRRQDDVGAELPAPAPCAARRRRRHPAALADAAPVGESSMARQSAARHAESFRGEQIRVGMRLGPGHRVAGDDGLRSGRTSTIGAAIGAYDIVTSACGIPAIGQLGDELDRTGTPRHIGLQRPRPGASRGSRPPARRSASDPSRVRMYSPLAIREFPTSCRASSSVHSAPCSAASSCSAAIHIGSVSTIVPSRSHRTAA